MLKVVSGSFFSKNQAMLCAPPGRDERVLRVAVAFLARIIWAIRDLGRQDHDSTSAASSSEGPREPGCGVQATGAIV